MPVDIVLSNSVLNQYRRLLKDCKSKNAECDEYKVLQKLLERMESLADQHVKFQNFVDQLVEEDLMEKFIAAYTRYCDQKKEKLV